MTSSDDKELVQPYAHHRITKYIAAQIDAIKKEKNQREIAMELGYMKPNMVSMLKRGEVRVPIEKIPLLAKALHVDAAHLYRMAVEDYWPSQAIIMRQIFGTVVSQNEAAFLDEWRKATKDADPAMTAELRKKLVKAFAGIV